MIEPLALWVPADDDAGPPQPWMEDTHRGRVGHRQTTLGAWTWLDFELSLHGVSRILLRLSFRFVSFRFVLFVPFRSFRFVLRSAPYLKGNDYVCDFT